MNLKNLYFIFILLFISLSSFSGGGGVVNTGGGHGVSLNNKIYLLDFYNLGVHESIHLPDCSDQTLSFHSQKLKTSGFVGSLNKAIVCTLNKFYNIDPVFAELIYQGILFHEWVFSNQALMATEHSSPYANTLDIVQVAVRQSRYVHINIKYWKRMNLENKVGLIFHEVFSALTKPTVHLERVRQTLALVFTKNTNNEIKNLLTADFPSTNQLRDQYSEISYQQNLYPIDTERKSDLFQRISLLPFNKIKIATDSYLYKIDNGELLLSPYVSFKFSHNEKNNTVESYYQYSEFYFYKSRSFFQKFLCTQSRLDILETVPSFNPNSHLIEIFLHYRHFSILPIPEDQNGNLNPSILWTLDEQPRKEIFSFSSEIDFTIFATCSEEQKAEFEKILKKLSLFKIL